MEELKVKAPAKINFGLNIVRKRPDGFHDLETIFYPINLFDEITFKISDSLTFSSNNEELNSDKSNLILKAVEVLEKFSSKKLNVDIKLIKRIPIGGGLGGGSSDAAATLKAVNKLFELKLRPEQLNRVALELGSDVPFFIDPKPCLAESRGEILKPVNFKIRYPILIVNPEIHVSTKWAFGRLNPKTPEFSLKNIDSFEIKDLKSLNKYVTNDFENIVFEKYPEIKKIKNDLYKFGASFALMTGSGSTVFGIFENVEQAVEAKEKFSKNYFNYMELPEKGESKLKK